MFFFGIGIGVIQVKWAIFLWQEPLFQIVVQECRRGGLKNLMFLSFPNIENGKSQASLHTYKLPFRELQKSGTLNIGIRFSYGKMEYNIALRVVCILVSWVRVLLFTHDHYCVSFDAKFIVIEGLQVLVLWWRTERCAVTSALIFDTEKYDTS